MATIANQYDPDEKEQPNTGGGGDVMDTGGGGTSADVSGGGSTPQARGTPSGTPNVQQYLAANQGAGQQLTEGITKNVQNQADKVNQGVSNAQNQLNTQYEPLQKNLASGQQVANSAFKDPQALLDSYNAAKTQSSSQPLSQAGADQYNQFQKLNTGGYNQDIQNLGQNAQQQYGQVQNQLQNFNQNAPSATTEAGRFQLLQNAVGQPNYNQGQQTLDALFLQGQPGGARQLQQNIGGIKQQTNQNINAASSDVNNKLQALQGLSGQNQDYIKNLFTQGNGQDTGLNQIGQNVQNEYAQAQKNQSNAQAIQAAQNGTLTPEQINQLKMQSGMHTYGVDFHPYLTANALGTGAEGLANAATPEEFARYNALNQLAGGPAGTAQQSIFGTASKAGGYTPFNFNNQGFEQAVANKKNTIENVDFQNALQQTLGNFNMNYSPSGGGPGKVPTGGVSVPIAQQLQQGLAAGTLTPQQANDIINNGVSNLTKTPGVTREDASRAFQPFLNYYNSEYSPAYNSMLGQTNPDSTPLPDFSQIPRPGGK